MITRHILLKSAKKKKTYTKRKNSHREHMKYKLHWKSRYASEKSKTSRYHQAPEMTTDKSGRVQQYYKQKKAEAMTGTMYLSELWMNVALTLPLKWYRLLDELKARPETCCPQEACLNQKDKQTYMKGWKMTSSANRTPNQGWAVTRLRRQRALHNSQGINSSRRWIIYKYTCT